MNLDDYNGKKPERFLQFKYFFWALCVDIVFFGDVRPQLSFPRKYERNNFDWFN